MRVVGAKKILSYKQNKVSDTTDNDYCIICPLTGERVCWSERKDYCYEDIMATPTKPAKARCEFYDECWGYPDAVLDEGYS